MRKILFLVKIRNDSFGNVKHDQNVNKIIRWENQGQHISATNNNNNNNNSSSSRTNTNQQNKTKQKNNQFFTVFFQQLN